jgi:hypothetical protein
VKKQDISVESLVDLVERGELQLPEIQRRYVWRAPRVRDLLDSLYRGYPSGSILVWESDQPVPARELQVHAQSTGQEPRKLLLDGQQRLTSLAAVIRGRPIHVRGRKRPIDILFNLEHPDNLEELVEVEGDEESPLEEDDADDVTLEEEDDGEEDLQARLQKRTFVVASKQLAQLPNWASVTEIFKQSSDAPFLKRIGITSLDDPRYEKYTQRLQRLRQIRQYPYVMHVLERDLSYEEVAEIFVRVNSLGAKLRASDLALAQITARWPTSLRLLEEFQEECEESWFTLDLGLLVRTMVVFATRQAKFDTVASVPIARFKSAWDEAKEGLRFAINFLRSNADIEDESLLSAPMLIIPLAVFSRLKSNQLSAAESRDLLYWLLVANARGRYSRGSTETYLNEDLALLFKNEPLERLLANVRQQFGRLHVEPADLVGRGQRSPLFSLAYLALKAAGAKDWHSGLGLSLTHQGKLHFIQFHHIFPKAVLRKAGYEKAEINEIGNMAFISGQTNRRLAIKPPEDYFPRIIEQHGEAALASQAIPLDSPLHKIENYRLFLETRRNELARLMNAHLECAREGASS